MSEDGLTRYLFEIISALVVIVWGTVSASFGRRLNRVEDAVQSNNDQIHAVDGDLKKHVDDKFRELDKKLEYRRIETKQDVSELRKEMARGHSEILKEIKNGHG